MTRITILALLMIGMALSSWAETPRASFMEDGLTLEQVAFGAAVQDRELTGEAESFSIGDRVYCWNLLTGAQPDELIYHVWYLDDREIQRIELSVQGPYWRTWSYKTLFPGMAGQWRVEVHDAQDSSLGSATFSVNE